MDAQNLAGKINSDLYSLPLGRVGYPSSLLLGTHKMGPSMKHLMSTKCNGEKRRVIMSIDG
jgi:hypothetical protein